MPEVPVNAQPTLGRVKNPVTQSVTVADYLNYDSWILKQDVRILVLPQGDATMDGKTLQIFHQQDGTQISGTDIQNSQGISIAKIQSNEMVWIYYKHGVGYFSSAAPKGNTSDSTALSGLIPQ